MTAFSVSDSLTAQLEEFCRSFSRSGVLKLWVERDVELNGSFHKALECEASLSPAMRYTRVFQLAQEQLDEATPSALLILLPSASNTAKSVLIMYFPDNASSLVKINFMCAKLSILRLLSGYLAEYAYGAPSVEMSCTEKSKVTYEEFCACEKDPYAQDAPSELGFAQQARDNSKLPIDILKTRENAQRLLARFATRAESCLQLTIDDETATLQASSVSSPDQETLCSVIAGQQTLCAYFLQRLRDREKAVFALVCEEGATMKHRLLYTSLKREVLAIVKRAGVLIFRSVDLRPSTDNTAIEETTNQNLNMSSAMPSFNRPTPPGGIPSIFADRKSIAQPASRQRYFADIITTGALSMPMSRQKNAADAPVARSGESTYFFLRNAAQFMFD